MNMQIHHDFFLIYMKNTNGSLTMIMCALLARNYTLKIQLSLF